MGSVAERISKPFRKWNICYGSLETVQHNGAKILIFDVSDLSGNSIDGHIHVRHKSLRPDEAYPHAQSPGVSILVESARYGGNS